MSEPLSKIASSVRWKDTLDYARASDYLGYRGICECDRCVYVARCNNLARHVHMRRFIR